jgi:predicted nuclease of predicted toxin-antitoxin system
MNIVLYMDEHVDPAVTRGLRRRGIEVHTVQEEGQRHTPDPVILDRALANGWTVFSMDEDFLAHATHRQKTGDPFSGVIFSIKDRWPIGILIEHLEIVAKVLDAEELVNRIQYVPIR